MRPEGLSRNDIGVYNNCYKLFLLGKEDNFTESGDDIIFEDLKQLCLLHGILQHADFSSATLQWMKYVSSYHNDCQSHDHRSDSSICSDKLLAEMGVLEGVRKCTSDENLVRKLLNTEKNSKAWAPLALRINDLKFTGPLDVPLLIRAVCSTLDSKPSICHNGDDGIYPNNMIGIKQKNQSSNTTTSSSMGSTLIYYSKLLIVSFASMVMGYHLFRKYAREHIRNDLRQQIRDEIEASKQREYKPVQDGNLEMINPRNNKFV